MVVSVSVRPDEPEGSVPGLLPLVGVDRQAGREKRGRGPAVSAAAHHPEGGERVAVTGAEDVRFGGSGFGGLGEGELEQLVNILRR